MLLGRITSKHEHMILGVRLWEGEGLIWLNRSKCRRGAQAGSTQTGYVPAFLS